MILYIQMKETITTMEMVLFTIQVVPNGKRRSEMETSCNSKKLQKELHGFC